jgi:methyltransferase (TIGR00027 family)
MGGDTTVGERRVEGRASFTAQTCAARRAAENMQPPRRRMLDDPHSRHFVQSPFLRACLIHPVVARGFIGLLNYAWGPAGHVFTVLRVRYSDDILDAALAAGIDQIILLGAGFDTTALRNSHTRARIFEVDAPTTQRVKRAVIENRHLSDREDLTTWVACDFEQDNLRETLLESGLDPARASVVIWIGVTAYLTQSAIDQTLGDLAAICAPGSELVVDYITAATSETPAGLRRWARDRGSSARRGEPWRSYFSSADMGALLASNGFQCREHMTTAELLARYVPAHDPQQLRNDRLELASAQRTR